MRLPLVDGNTLARLSQRKGTIYNQQFIGYNHNLRCQNGQFYDMQNMTGDYSPVLSTRSLRTQLLVLTGEPQALFCKDYVYYISGGDLVWGIAEGDADTVDMSSSNDLWTELGRIRNCVTPTGRKQIADIGAKVLIMPDKKIFNVNTKTISSATFYFENNTWTRVVEGVSYTTESKLRVTPCTLDGETITYTAQASAPSDTSAYWLNTGDKGVYRYSASSEIWEKLATVYVKVEPVLEYGAAGPGTDALAWLDSIKSRLNELKDYDTVSLTLEDFNDDYGIIGGDEQIFHVGDGFFVIAGLVESAANYDFELKNRFPELAFITSLNNRIWGCSSNGREIYASKLGDPTQWYNYAGLASDSYAATVGSDGEFTGAIAYNNNVLFFKKDRLHKIFGNYPSNFQVSEYAVNGVASGCDRTLCVVNGYLFYLGEESVMIYDGSMPRNCSEEFGDLRFTTGVAGQQMNKYYLSTVDGDTVRQFVYDTETWQWWKEDDSRMLETATYFNNLYSIHQAKAANGTTVAVLTKEVGFYEGTMDWFVETGDLGLDSPLQKYISKIQIRMAVEGTLYVEISYDGGKFTRVLDRTYDHLRSNVVPINVKRCDHFRFRIGGRGVAKIYSIGYNVESGSEVC